MGVYDELLAIQQHDTHLDQLRHRRETLPERAQRVAAQRESVTAAALVVTLEAERDELQKAEGRLEDHLALVEAKAKEVNATLYGGGVTSPKELQVLQDEIDALGRRQRDLEDQVLELMERLEPVTASLDSARDEVGSTADAAESAAARVTAAEAEIDVELAEVTSARAAAVTDVPADVVEDYETLRGRLGGIAVARLEAGWCGGCNLGLSAVEVDRIRGLEPDETVHCEECGRLLVR